MATVNEDDDVVKFDGDEVKDTTIGTHAGTLKGKRKKRLTSPLWRFYDRLTEKTIDERLVRTRISSRQGTHACAYATRLGSVHLPGDARRTHVRMSRHLPFYDPKVEGRQ
ncbi:hypothetical protein CRG98_007307, partial [Punica granatum]